ncbi:hypothetical protein AKJ41_03655, partial [candidate division MSBL1 archaeon SCGC-AAA259O05]
GIISRVWVVKKGMPICSVLKTGHKREKVVEKAYDLAKKNSEEGLSIFRDFIIKDPKLQNYIAQEQKILESAGFQLFKISELKKPSKIIL